MDKLSFSEFVEAFNREQGWTTTDQQLQIAKFLENQRGDKRSIVIDDEQLLLPLFATWLLYRDPTESILMCADTLVLAQRNTFCVKNIIEDFSLCQGMKPDQPELWQQYSFTINRDTLDSTPSVQCTSMRSSHTGMLATRILFYGAETLDENQMNYLRALTPQLDCFFLNEANNA